MHLVSDAGVSPVAPRVVFLSLRMEKCCATCEAVHTTSCYEAAAELLAAPPAAIVIDLALLGPRHLGLLDVARDAGVEMLAFGAIGAALTSEDLSGVRLVSRADLPGAIEALSQHETPPIQPTQTPQAVLETPDAEEPQEAPAAEAVPNDELPAERERIIAAGTAPRTEGSYESEGPQAPEPPPAGQAERPPSPAELLTPEELAALLGDDMP